MSGFAGAAHAQPPAAAPLETARDHVQRYEKRLGAMEQAWSEGDTNTAVRHREEALEHIRTALDLFRAAGADTADDPELVQEYAAACRLAGYWDLAAEALAHLARSRPRDAALHADLGEACLRTGPAKHAPALDALKHALTLNPAPPIETQAHTTLGDLYWTLRLYDTARAHYRNALETAPGAVRAAIGMAVVEARAGDIVAASERLDALGRSLQTHDAEVRVKLRDALHGFDTLRRTLPNTATHHRAYGRLLYRAARVSEALLALRQAVRIEPDDAETWAFIGNIQGQLGNVDQAANAFEKSLEADPDQPALRQQLEGINQAPQGKDTP